ncbi:MAG TPA: hypothetical protein VHS53_07435 [Mucilaginibacter sp.]|jgi:hypothetical protein|nr:hypothetical protein [Mucilaginibacter sp.]
MYKLARYIFSLILLLAITYKGYTQVRPIVRGPFYQQRTIRRQSKIEQVREAYLARRLALTPYESARFWPVYRQYQDALTSIRDKIRLNNSGQQPDGQQQIENNLQYQTDLLNVRKYYTTEFLRILPPQKVSEMNKAEREFQDELIKQLNERKQAVNPPPPTN